MIKFKSIQIKGFRGFVDSGDIDFNLPDGENNGSGLNVFIGENGSGKTSILKAISYLTLNKFSGQRKISSHDFNNQNEDGLIEVIGKIDGTIKYAMPPPYKRELNVKEFKTSVKRRDRKSPGRFLSPKLIISNILEPDSRTQDWFPRGDIPDFYLGFDNGRFVEDKGLYIFYFDEERNKQIKKGFATTFSRLMDDLNWKFLKDVDETEILAKWQNYYSEVVKEEYGEEIKKILEDRFNRKDLAEIKLELLNLEEPYSGAFFAIRSKDNLNQIPVSFLGSGVEFLFSFLFLSQIANQSKGTIIYCIDEPELSLHPQWQKMLFEILKEEAKTKQIFIATQSPYFIDSSVLGNVKRFYIKDNKINFSQLREEQVQDKKIQKLFSLENREILFSRGVILVEGIDDRMRLRSFLQTDNNDLFVIDGLQNLKRAKDICGQLEIKFKTIVDLDYLRDFPELLPDLSAEEIEYIDEISTLNKIIANLGSDSEKLLKEFKKVKKQIIENPLKCLSSKILYKMSNDTAYKTKVEKKILDLQGNKIFVLSKGTIEDYLNEYGKPKTKELGDELLTILEE